MDSIIARSVEGSRNRLFSIFKRWANCLTLQLPTRGIEPRTYWLRSSK